MITYVFTVTRGFNFPFEQSKDQTTFDYQTNNPLAATHVSSPSSVALPKIIKI